MMDLGMYHDVRALIEEGVSPLESIAESLAHLTTTPTVSFRVVDSASLEFHWKLGSVAAQLRGQLSDAGMSGFKVAGIVGSMIILQKEER